MAQLKVSFTISGEQSETIFKLIETSEGFKLKGFSEISGVKEIPIKKVDNAFVIDGRNEFAENQVVIEDRLLGLYEDFVEAQTEGIELSDDIEDYIDHKEKPGYGPDDIYVENKPFSIATLMELINDGDLEVAPNFQRHFVWDKTRQSKLIESILLGLPLPSIYLSQYSDGRLTIVDGLQRIQTIQKFMTDDLVLCNMEYFKDCNGKKYSQLKTVLPLLQYRKFRQTQIMCFVIDYRSPNGLKYDLFRRLNSGGKALNDQEIRNCLSRPPLQKLLKDMIESDEFKKATNNSLKDTRMAAQESALRFMYFYDQYSEDNPLGNYTGEMSECLDSYVEILNSRSEQDLMKYLEIFKKSMELAFALFGRNSFRKVVLKGNKKFAINKSLMLAMSVLLAHYYDVYKTRKNLTDEFADLLRTDANLSKVITNSTTHKTSISYALETLKKDLFDKYLLN